MDATIAVIPDRFRGRADRSKFARPSSSPPWGVVPTMIANERAEGSSIAEERNFQAMEVDVAACK